MAKSSRTSKQLGLWDASPAAEAASKAPRTAQSRGRKNHRDAPATSDSETLPEGAPSVLAKTLLEMARKLDATEDAIRREVLAALQQGDIARATKLLEKWIEGPVAEVLGNGEQPEAPDQDGVRIKRRRRRAEKKKNSADASA